MVSLLNEGWHRLKKFLSEIFFQSAFYGILALWVLLSGATLPTRILRRLRKTESFRDEFDKLETTRPARF